MYESVQKHLYEQEVKYISTTEESLYKIRTKMCICRYINIYKAKEELD
jgi:hypothetical protein